jgi:dethiobiotin synthetase
MMVVFCGTNTNVGKTFIGCRVVAQLRLEGWAVAVSKPMESGVAPGGEPVDAAALRQAAGAPHPLAMVCPWTFAPPVAPAVALHAEGRTVSADALREAVARVAEGADYVHVETAGGLLSPLTESLCSIDLATVLNAPVVLVAENTLGVISLVATALESIERRGVQCLAVVLNPIDATGAADRATNAEWIRRKAGNVPVLEGTIQQVVEALVGVLRPAGTPVVSR